MHRLKRPARNDALAAAAVLALGVFGIVESLGYRLGAMRNIGPGVFPLIVSAGLVISGLLILIEALAVRPGAEDADMSGAAPRVLIFVTAALLAFAVLMPPAGLVPAIVVAVGLSALADGSLRLWQVAALAAGVAGFCALVFVYFLNLPLDLVRWPIRP